MKFVSIFAVLLIGSVSAQQRDLKGLSNWKDAPVLTMGDESIETFEGGAVHSVASVEESQIPVLQAADRTHYTLVRLSREGAEAMRVKFGDFRLAEGQRLFVYSFRGDDLTKVLGPFHGTGPTDRSDFWTDALPGDHVVVELQWQVAPNQNLPFSIEAMAHQSDYLDAPAALVLESRPGGVAMYRGAPVHYEIIDGMAVAEGDMILGRADEVEPFVPGKSQPPSRDAIVITLTAYRWPGGVLPYIIDSGSYDSFETSRIMDAINQWNQRLAGTIRIVPRTTETNYVRFYRGSGCSSYIGRIGGVQTISIGSGCFSGQAIHEIGHALGLFHEQSRNDRDSFVTINWANIQTGKSSNFNKAGSMGTDVNSYDFGSIMHYGATAFSINGLPTIVTIPPGIPIGQRTSLSTADVVAIQQSYGGSTPPPAPSTVTVTVQTNPSGQTVRVDGVNYAAPRTFSWTSGSAHTLEAVDYNSSTLKYRFASWSDGGAKTHTVNPTSNMTYTASYSTHHKVTASPNSASYGTATVSPASSDPTFYPTGTLLTVTGQPNSGNCFLNWSGSMSSTNPSLSITVNNTYSLTGNFGTGAVTISPSSASVAAAVGSVPVSVTASGGCGWNATSGAGWITASPASGSSSGTVTLTVAANPTTAQRTGNVTINGSTVTLTQAAAAATSCTITSGVNWLIVQKNGGPMSIPVTTNSGCNWTATSTVGWAAPSPASGSGSTTLTVTVQPNSASSIRYGWIRINNISVLIYQMR